MKDFAVSTNFPGGNAIIKKIEGNTVFLDSDLRDTVGDWFYWAICVEGAQGKTLSFDFGGEIRVGYYGPAVSYDLKHWKWLGKDSEASKFTYTFTEDETKVYFAHNMIYSEKMFLEFAEKKHLPVKILCQSKKKRDVPYVIFGEGKKSIVLTARHHACESTGSYVLEGVLDRLYTSPLNDIQVFCVPFVDFDGVIDGDQGKNRTPYDHNRDYAQDKKAIYPETAKIREYIDTHSVFMGFDFHSPWHTGNENDLVCIIQKSIEKRECFIKFGELLDTNLTKKALQHNKENDIPPNGGTSNWNRTGTPTFAVYVMNKPENEIAFTLETCYFGRPDNIFTQEGARELGRCFADAIFEYIHMRS